MINEYFYELGESLKVEPRAIVNYHESNLTDDPGSKKILCRRETKHPTRVLDMTNPFQLCLQALQMGRGFHRT